MNLEQYIEGFGDLHEMPLSEVHREMDRVWQELGLDNSRPLAEQGGAVGAFYVHPVWTLNGLFSEQDDESSRNRQNIADWTASVGARYIADYGGGSGVLATMIIERLPGVSVEIVEPFPAKYFLKRNRRVKGLAYVDRLGSGYDLAIAQDVLEHLDDPLALAVELVEAVKPGGYLVFANCFYPMLECHLPATFYLRHQFKWLLKLSGLEHVGKVPGVDYAQVFRRNRVFTAARLHRMARLTRRFGWLTNALGGVVSFVRGSIGP